MGALNILGPCVVYATVSLLEIRLSLSQVNTLKHKHNTREREYNHKLQYNLFIALRMGSDIRVKVFLN